MTVSVPSTTKANRDSMWKAFNQYIALYAGFVAMIERGDTEKAAILSEMSDDAYAAYKAEREKREQELACYKNNERMRQLDWKVKEWADQVPYSRKRNPREKNHVHRVSVALTPDQAWLVENIRVPFLFDIVEEQIIFATRCHREAVAVKMRWG